MNLADRLDRERIIHQLGLDRQITTMDTVLPALGIFSAGLLVGVGIGLMIAPKSGRELRSDINRNVHEFSDRTQHMVQDAANRTQHFVQDAATRARQRLTRQEAEAAGAPAGELPADENPYA